MSLRTDLGKVRGLGSAKEGVGHWWAQRLTAIALIPLLVWFVASVVPLVGAELRIVREWISSPVNSVLLLSLIVAVFHHAQLGLQVVIEDYVHTGWLKLASVIAVKFAAFGLSATSLFAVLKIAFTG
ncbi:MAG: succinate dehydrogenase, hydrophobic membrane anchor protein [Alphaproteobacteria bacterium]